VNSNIHGSLSDLSFDFDAEQMCEVSRYQDRIFVSVNIFFEPVKLRISRIPGPVQRKLQAPAHSSKRSSSIDLKYSEIHSAKEYFPEL
jgi:hypothetical protein